MKKLFTLFAALAVSACMMAQIDLLSRAVDKTWDSSYDSSTKTMTWTAAWGGCGWDMLSTDLSAYNEVYFEFQSAVTEKVLVTIAYDGGGTVEAETESGTELTAQFDGTKKVEYIVLKLSQAGTLALKQALVRGNAQGGQGGGEVQNKELSLTNLNAGWESSYDAATKTITFNGEWKARGWTLNNMDVTPYKDIYFEFASIPTKVLVSIDGKDAGEATEGTELIIPLTGVSTINELLIKTDIACSLVLKKAEFRLKDGGQGGEEPVKAQDLSISQLGNGWDGASVSGNVVTFAQNEWTGGVQWWFGFAGEGMNWNQYDSLVLEIEPATIKVVLKIEYNAETNNVAEAPIEVGGTRCVIALDAVNKADVQKVYLLAENAGSFTIKRCYVTARKVVTSIDETAEGIVNLGGYRYMANAVVFDIQGRAVAQSENGVIDLSNMPSGIYLLRSANQTLKVLK